MANGGKDFFATAAVVLPLGSDWLTRTEAGSGIKDAQSCIELLTGLGPLLG